MPIVPFRRRQSQPYLHGPRQFLPGQDREALATPAQIFGSALQFWGRADLGLSTNGAALLTTASNQYFSLANALVTGYPFTISTWVNSTNLSQNNGLWGLLGTNTATLVGYANVESSGVIGVSFNGNSTYILGATTLSAGTWYNVIVSYDGTTCNIYINGVKDANSGPLASSFGTLANTFIGLSATSVAKTSASLGPFQVWSRVLGSGEIATVAAGVLYRGFTSSLQNGNVCSIEFTKPGNLGVDNSPNNANFTPVNSPTYVAGNVTYTPPAGTYLLAGEAVSAWADQSGYGNNLLQATGSSRPTMSLNVQNGLPMVLFPVSGSTYLALSSPNVPSGNTARLMAIVASSSAVVNHLALNTGTQDTTTRGSFAIGAINNPAVLQVATQSDDLITTLDTGTGAFYGAGWYDGNLTLYASLNNGTPQSHTLGAQLNTVNVAMNAGTYIPTYANWQGYLGEAVIAHNPTTSQMNSLYAYVKSRWATP